MRLWAAFLLLLLLLPHEVGAGSLRTEINGLRLELASEPDQPVQGRETVYILSLRDAAGSPVTGAKVTLMGRMADGMTLLAPLRQAPEPGIYRGRVLFTMQGPWNLTLRVVRTGQPLEFLLTEQVGQ